MSIKGEIKKSTHKVFRRIYLKRRETDGEYETDWQLIDPKYVKRFGTIDKGVDALKQNHFSSSGFNFTVDNTTGRFSETTDDKSIFYQKLSRYRTLVKVEAGYIETDGTEQPTNPSLFIGLMKSDMPYKQDNTISFKVDHIDQIFKEYPADRIAGLGAVQTAKSIIETIRDATEGSDVLFFQKYITSGGWKITSTARTYNVATSASLEGKSVWDFMKQLAEAENRIMFIDRSGDFNFVEREPTSTSEYHFSGIGDTDRTYGKNVLRNISVDNDIRNVYNRIRIKYDKPETSTSYKIKNEVWNWGDSSSSFKYGIKTYEYQNEFMTEAVASETASDIFDEFSDVSQVIKLQAKFVPQLDILDRVNVTYKTQVRTGSDLWGAFLWDYGIWGERSGKNIEVDGDYKITKIRHNIGKFTTDLILREI